MARQERGSAAVEFALIVPILCALVFGIINFGDILSARQAVSQAAAEGARAGAVSQKAANTGPDSKEQDAKNAVDRALKTQGASCSGCDIKIGKTYVRPGGDPATDTQTCDGDSCVWVTVIVDHKALVPGFTFGFGGKLRYTASARVS